jgi:hypothetical protein
VAPTSFRKYADRVLLAGVFSLAFVYSLRRMSDTDLWGHLKCGEYFFQHGAILKTYFYNCSWPDFPYMNHEWLFQAVIYRVYEFSGEWGLVALQVTLVLASFWLLYRILRIYTDNIPLISFILFLGIIASSHRFALRPQHFTYVFFLSFLFSLHRYQRGDRKFAWLMPPVMVIWANMHAESLWGIVVPGIFVAAEYLRRRINRERGKDLRTLAVIFFLTVCASMANPFTYKTVVWPFFVMKEQFAGVEELLSPTHPRYLFFWLYCLLFVLSTAFNIRRVNPVWLTLGILYAAVAWTANRGIPHFVFVSAPLIAVNCRDLLERAREKFRIPPFTSDGMRLALLSCVGIILISVLASPAYLKKYDNVPYPEGALKFLRDHGVKGNVFNHHPWGCFIIWNSYPSLRPYIDGRFFHKKFYDEFNYISSVGPGWQELLDRYQITIALLPYSATDQGTLNDRLFSGIHWRLVYWDDVSLLYLKDSEGNRPVIEQFGDSVINPDRELYDYRETSPDMLRQANAVAERNILSAKNSYKAFLLSANTHFAMGEYLLALKRFGDSLDHGWPGNAATYYRMALCYRNMGDLAGAEAYLRKSLAGDPDYGPAQQQLREVTILRERR